MPTARIHFFFCQPFSEFRAAFFVKTNKIQQNKSKKLLCLFHFHQHVLPFLKVSYIRRIKLHNRGKPSKDVPNFSHSRPLFHSFLVVGKKRGKGREEGEGETSRALRRVRLTASMTSVANKPLGFIILKV